MTKYCRIAAISPSAHALCYTIIISLGFIMRKMEGSKSTYIIVYSRCAGVPKFLAEALLAIIIVD